MSLPVMAVMKLELLMQNAEENKNAAAVSVS